MLLDKSESRVGRGHDAVERDRRMKKKYGRQPDEGHEQGGSADDWFSARGYDFRSNTKGGVPE